MLNDPQPPEKRRHPLEEAPQRPPEMRPDQPARPRVTVRMPLVPPRATYILMAINIVVFAVGMLSPALDQQMFVQGASRSYEVLVLGEYHRLFTAMFLHGGIMHIFFNMYALYIIGRGIEPVFGSVRLTIIYLLGGLAGSILSVVLGDPSPISGVASVGASGAVFALFGAEMIYLYRHRTLMGARATSQLRSLLMLLGINLFIGLASWFGDSGIRIDNWAHMGGLAGGLILTWLLGPIFTTTRDPLQPHLVVAEDTNPLAKNYWLVSLYVIALVAVLMVFSFMAR
ncbi:MAG: rhomboid family intramembrane serine protease [Anaerolineae bacterium]|nr:rhomboid family intramembrane serine protease [Anaerolineae bacterium]